MQRNKRLLRAKKAKKKKRLKIRDWAKVEAAKAAAKRRKPVKSKTVGRCAGKLKSGEPCTRKATRTRSNGKSYCWQHGSKKKKKKPAKKKRRV